MLTKNNKADKPEHLSHIFLKLHPTIIMFKGTLTKNMLWFYRSLGQYKKFSNEKF